METKLQELELEWNEALSKAQVKEKRVEELEVRNFIETLLFTVFFPNLFYFLSSFFFVLV